MKKAWDFFKRNLYKTFSESLKAAWESAKNARKSDVSASKEVQAFYWAIAKANIQRPKRALSDQKVYDAVKSMMDKTGLNEWKSAMRLVIGLAGKA